MSSKAEVIRKWHEESWASPPASMTEATSKYFSDDYQGFDQDGNAITDKAGYIGMIQIFLNAFEDFKGVLHNVSEENGSVIMTFHWEGIHTGDFDLSAMGLGVIPASGKRFATPKSKTLFVVEDDKIVANHPVDGGGMESLLAALGVKLPGA